MTRKPIFALTTLSVVLFSQLALAGSPGHHGHKGGKFMRFFDSNNDGQVARAEFEKAAVDRFKRIDTDTSGTVTKEEFKAYVKQRRAKRRERKLGKIDTNGDGNVSKEEFVAYKTKKIERGFTRMDKNNDGQISKEEFTSHKRKHRKSPRKIFKRLDINGDGQITQAESLQKWGKWFDRLDANNDGTVTTVEIKNARHKRRHG